MSDPKYVTLYDSIDVAALPAGGRAYAGYVGGRWPTFRPVKLRFPDAKVVSIAVNVEEDADILDVERGDATPVQVAGWVRRQSMRGAYAPGFYTSISQAGWILKDLLSHGIPRHRVRVWTAHWTGVPHLCDTRCAADFQTRAGATQYVSCPGGRSFDVSLCRPQFLP